MRLGTSGFRRRYCPVEGKEFAPLYTDRDSIFPGEQPLSATELKFSNPSLSRRYRVWPIFVVGFGCFLLMDLAVFAVGIGVPPAESPVDLPAPPRILRRTTFARNTAIFRFDISFV